MTDLGQLALFDDGAWVKVRRKRDPGRCFRKAGWFKVDVRRGLVVLQASEAPQ